MEMMVKKTTERSQTTEHPPKLSGSRCALPYLLNFRNPESRVLRPPAAQTTTTSVVDLQFTELISIKRSS
jgi:uncharacterized protein with von Willebrand factor type A (vWA) domain